jgi:hypothetical protein
LFVCGAAADAGCTEVLAESVTASGVFDAAFAAGASISLCGFFGLGSSASKLFSALPGLGSETATVLFGRAIADCPEAEVVKNGTNVNANATEALMNAQSIDTIISPGAIPN